MKRTLDPGAAHMSNTCMNAKKVRTQPFALGHWTDAIPLTLWWGSTSRTSGGNMLTAS